MAARNDIMWALIALALRETLNRLAVAYSGDPRFIEALADITADILADGKNTIFPDPTIPLEDERETVRKMIEQLGHAFGEALKIARKVDE